jgi:hypothetical protein
MEMFNNDEAAFQTCVASYVMQENWYPDPIGYLFSYQTWNGFDGFWQDGVTIEAFVNAMKYGNNTRFKSVVDSSYRTIDQLTLAYAP